MSEQAARRRHKSRFVERFEAGLMVAGGTLLRLSPRGIARRIGSTAGAVARHLIRERRVLAEENLALVMPDLDAGERQRILRECWRHFGAEMADYVRHLDRPGAELGERVDIVGRENFERAISAGRGVVAFSAHIGSWEAAVAALPRLGAKFLVVARPLDNRLLEQRIQTARGRGVEVVHRLVAARPIAAALQDRRPVITLPDQAVLPREGELIPFLGRDAWTTTAPARLAIRFGAPLLPMFCYPDGMRYRLEIAEPLFVDELPEDARDAQAVTRWVNDTISDAIRAHPSQWLWLHDRWKRA